jgi:hypothetical protein
MTSGTPGLVDIVRDFFAVDQALRRLVESYRNGELRFEEVQALFADDEATPLFRLKERCHALFRSGADSPRQAHLREVLFDLAVGSLFHEAMKFRESFYQREVYGPRVRALREAAGDEAAALFQEFQKILATVSDRLDEGLAETEALLEQTREQLAVLLAEHPEDGYVARFLIEQREEAEAVFGSSLDAIFAEAYGAADAGFRLAGISYLDSGYFEEAERSLCESQARSGNAELEPLIHYARGMAAYMRGEYAETVEQLGSWAAAAAEFDVRRTERALAVVGTIDQLAQGADRDPVVSAAARLAERLTERRGAAAASV